MKPKTKRNSFRKQMDEYYRMMIETGQIDSIKKPRKTKKRKAAKHKEYSFVERETQEIHRTNHAPLGRPPTDPGARKKYDKAKARPTRYAKKRK